MQLPDRKAITAWAQFLRAHRVLLERVERALAGAGLPPLAWYDVLIELHGAAPGGLRQFELCERTLLQKHNLSRLLDRLAGRGLIERRPCAEDRRGSTVTITAAGEATLEAMWPVYGGVIERSFSGRLEEAEMATLGRLMARLLSG